MTHQRTRRLFSLSAAIALCALLVAFAAPASAVVIPTVPVGNAGNAPDQLWASNNPTNLLFGSVAYDYRIGTTEVTNAQYAEFLNFKAASDPLALYNTRMGSDARGGIARSGSGTIPDPYVYTTKTDMGNKPVNYVSWYDSIRFANWLHNGQGSGDTETGAYTLLGGTPTPSNANLITRNTGATWFLASEDEWYKAAYYDPSGSSYFDYPTSSDTAPVPGTPGQIDAANYNNTIGDVIDVGFFPTTSPYGTFDQGGNVFEWNEALISGSYRGLRGGSFYYDAYYLQSSVRIFNSPTYEDFNRGFRVATVPEPSTAVLGMIGFAGLAVLGWRGRALRRAALPAVVVAVALGAWPQRATAEIKTYAFTGVIDPNSSDPNLEDLIPGIYPPFGQDIEFSGTVTVDTALSVPYGERMLPGPIGLSLYLGGYHLVDWAGGDGIHFNPGSDPFTPFVSLQMGDFWGGLPGQPAEFDSNILVEWTVLDLYSSVDAYPPAPPPGSTVSLGNAPDLASPAFDLQKDLLLAMRGPSQAPFNFGEEVFTFQFGAIQTFTLVPEPSTIVLAGMAAIGLLLVGAPRFRALAPLPFCFRSRRRRQPGSVRFIS